MEKLCERNFLFPSRFFAFLPNLLNSSKPNNLRINMELIIACPTVISILFTFPTDRINRYKLFKNT